MPTFCPTVALLNLYHAYAASDPVGKGIVILLLVYSVFVWARLAMQWSALNRAIHDTRRFLIAFSKDAHPLRVFLGHDKFVNSPLYTVYEGGCRTLMEEVNPGGIRQDSLFKANPEMAGRRLSEAQMEVVHKTIDRLVLEQALETQGHMGFLATAINLAPFLGLFGTVWGVMDAFNAMASKGVPTLAEIAPGVTSALLTTVAGLMVAIPASYGYSQLTEKIRRIMVQLDNFAGEFGVELKRHYHPSASNG